ncbi:MAG: isoprenyl transferase [Eubacteriales bacterium]|nr:isoprenyl transferase [Eubacteriales bacterium]
MFGRKKKQNTDVYSSIDKQQLPSHVAVIMDGNGRWAKRRGLPRSAGHRAGTERVRTIIRMSSDVGIRYLTLFALSTENWKRPKDEINTLMKLLLEYLRQELHELHERNVRINTLGDISKLPKEVADEIARAKQTTKDNTGLTVNMAINYGARQEIMAAVKKAIADGTSPDSIDEAYLSSLLDTAGQPDPDLMIRTSGEARISNFLLYQMAYAEFYFTDTLWPDFDEAEYAKALKVFAARDRRFGGI